MARTGHAVLCFWHETLPLAIYTYRNTGFHTLTSYSYDGEIAARLIEPFGLHALRGSSSRGGAEALRELEKAIQLVPIVGITNDGPKGPRRESKPGPAILAARTQNPIIPNAFAITRCKRMKSWDRLIFPAPFSRIVCAYGPAIDPPSDTSEEAIESTRLELELAMNRLQESLESELNVSKG